MRTREIKPIPERPSDYDELEKIISEYFRDEIYLPLIVELSLPKKTLKNSSDYLAEAIRCGRVTFNKGQFRGRFNSIISKELRKLGAEWDRKQLSFRIPLGSLPVELRNAISMSSSAFEQVLEKILRKIEKVIPDKLIEKLRMTSFFDKALFKTQKNINETLKSMTVQAQLSDKGRLKIAEEYTNTTQLYIKNFTKKQTVELRKNIEKRVFNGDRYEGIAKEIQKSYGVSQRKAKFLARQETSILMSTFKETRYRESGSDEYRWQCVRNPKDASPDKHVLGNVRYYHGLNDGKIFRWDSPPIINKKGERKNPGMDYECRCVARPLVKF